jgi:two-component system sensor histidine kinase KdpD
LNRNWYAVYVQTSKERPTVIDAATQRMLSNTLTLAQELGATVFTYKGDDVVRTILQFAKEYRVGHIVIGTPGKKTPLWKRLRGERSIVDRLVVEGTGITVVVLDTKAIREDRLTSEMMPQTFESNGCSTGRKDLKLESDTALSKVTVLFWEKLIDKEEAMRRLLDSCIEVGQDLMGPAWVSILDREKQGGTFVGEDVAIPHARLVGLPRPVISIGYGRAGIQDRDSQLKFRIMVLLLSPAESPERHLKMLGVISKMVRDDQWRKNVLSARKPADIVAIIQKWEDGKLVANEK